MMDTRVFSQNMIDNIRSHMDDSVRFITFPKFVFLCGKYKDKDYKSSNRGIAEKFILSKNTDVRIVLSEQLWEDNFDSSIDLLTFEEFLAEVSDFIILFVESPGSFCELGAFAYADELFRDKLVVVVGQQFEREKSFIITGPTLKLKNMGTPVIYAPIDGTGLLSCHDLRIILDEKTQLLSSKAASINKKRTNTKSDRVLIGSFIIELLELIKLTQPISKVDLLDLYKKIKGFSSFTFVKSNDKPFSKEIKYDYIIKLLLSVKLINNNYGLLSTVNNKQLQRLMLNYTDTTEVRERNRLICRKFRYDGGSV